MANTCKTCGKKTSRYYECEACDVAQQIEDGATEIDSHEEIYCPYCGADFEQGFDNPELFEEGEQDMSCYECDKPFVVDIHVSYFFTSKKS